MLTQEAIINDTDRLVGQVSDHQEEHRAILNDAAYRPHLPKCKQLYDKAFLVEWILMSSYTAGDFGHRFIWPELKPETVLDFLSA